MTYRFAKITSTYPLHADHLEKRLGRQISLLSHDELQKFFFMDNFGWADHYSKELRKLDAEVAEEIIINWDPLKKAYAREYKKKHLKKFDYIIHRLRQIKPDVLFVQNIHLIDEYLLKNIKEIIPSVKLLYGWICVYISEYLSNRLKYFDRIITCTPRYEEALKECGIKTKLIYHAFNPNIVNVKALKNKHKVLSFFGSLNLRNGMHRTRMSSLIELYNAGLPLDYYLHEPINYLLFSLILMAHPIKYLLPLKYRAVASEVHESRKYYYSWFKEYQKKLNIQEPLFGNALYNEMSKKLVSINNHIDDANCYAGNIRLFEATGCGSCLVTDKKKNLKDLFLVDEEIVVYKNNEELVDKAKYLLNNPNEAQKIACAGRKRVEKSHTFRERAISLEEQIKKDLS